MSVDDFEEKLETDSSITDPQRSFEDMEESEKSASVRLRERKVTDWIFTAAVIAIFTFPIVVCNWTHHWKEFGGGSRPGIQFQSHYPLGEMKVWAAGWPLVYFRRFELNGSTFEYHSWMMLVGNVFLAATYVVLVAIYVDRRRRSPMQKRFQLTMWDGLVATFVVSPLLLAWTAERYAQNLESEAVGQAVSIIDPIRTRRIPTGMPDWLVGYCPIQWARIESIAIERFPQLRPEKLSKMRCVGAISAKNQPLDASILTALISNNPLFEVYVQGSTLGKPQLDVLEGAPRQVVIYSNGSGTSLADFSSSVRFEHLVHFALLNNIASPKMEVPGAFNWAAHFPNMEMIQLPSPGEHEFSLAIRDLPNLKKARVDHVTVEEGMKPFSLTFGNLPKLETIHITPLAECDLKLENLPLLTEFRTTLEPAQGPTIFANTPMERFPSGIAFRSLDIADCATLKHFDLFAAKLKRLSVSGVPQLKSIGVDISYVKDFLQIEIDEQISEVISKYFSEDIEMTNPFGFQTILDGVSGCENLETINLSQVPMFGLDFSPLARLPNLRNLHIASCALKPRDLLTLRDCKRLEFLELTNNPIDAIGEGSFAGLDSLKSIVMEQPLRSLELSDLKELETLTFQFDYFIEEVELRNLPKCSFQFQLDTPVQKLVLKDLPKLTVIAINAPLPEDMEIENVPGLKVLLLRDPTIDDSHLKKMKKLNTVTNLNLGTTSLTPKALAAAGRLPELKYLVLDSTNLSDAEIKTWTCLPQLKSLDISETQVSSEGLRYILENSKLERLILGAMSFSPEVLALIAQQEKLSVLSLRFCTLEDADLQFLLKMPQLQLLDISGTNVSDKTMTELVKLPQLKYILAEGCQQVRGDKFLQALPGLQKFMALGLEGTLPESRLQGVDTDFVMLLPPGWMEGMWGSMKVEGLETIGAPAWRQLP